MKIRITGTRAECERALARLARVLEVQETSDFYPNQAPSALGRVYLEVDLTEPPGPPVRVRAGRTDTAPAVPLRCPVVITDE